jgi:hypothetical protein
MHVCVWFWPTLLMLRRLLSLLEHVCVLPKSQRSEVNPKHKGEPTFVRPLQKWDSLLCE